MNTLQNFFKKSFRIRNTTSTNDQHHHHHHYKIDDLFIKLDKDEFRSNDKITGKLVLKTYDKANIAKETSKILLKFYDELNIEWEEYQSHTLYNTKNYSTYKKPFKINVDSYLDPDSVELVNDVGDGIHANDENNQHKLYEYQYRFEFDLPEVIHSSVNMPNASYFYFIEAFIYNDTIEQQQQQQQQHHHYFNIFDHFKSNPHTNCKIEVHIYNEVMTPIEISLNEFFIKPQIFELQTSNLHIRVSVPKRAYYSNEILPIKIDIDDLVSIENHQASSTVDPNAVTTTHHNLKLNKIIFKLYQYCKVYSDEPEKRSKLFDYLIKQTNRKLNHDKHSSPSPPPPQQATATTTATTTTATNVQTIIENFEIPDQLFSSTNRNKLKLFNQAAQLTPKQISTLSYNENNLATTSLNENKALDETHNHLKFFYGIRVDYKLVIEFWKNFLSQDSIVTIPIMIDPEA